MSTAAERLIEQGRREGHLQGMETGRMEGRMQGCREGRLEAYRSLSRRLIELKFGQLVLEAIAQLEVARETISSTTPSSPPKPSAKDERTISGILNSFAEELLEEGRHEGRVQGEREGRSKARVEGRLEGFRSFVRLLVESRFGTLTPDAIERLDSADESMLEDCIELLLTASRVEQVLA